MVHPFNQPGDRQADAHRPDHQANDLKAPPLAAQPRLEKKSNRPAVYRAAGVSDFQPQRVCLVQILAALLDECHGCEFG